MELLKNIGPIKVEIQKDASGLWTLYRGSDSFYIKGAAGFEHIDQLVAFGGNSIRTWGCEQTDLVLPEVRRCGLSLCAGLWLEPPRRGFDYRDEVAIKDQFERIAKQVLKYKDERSLLLWGLGNELDLAADFDLKVWKAVEDLAAYIKEVDPFHPVMTVLASPRLDCLKAIRDHCPSLDLVGVNSYGDLDRVRPGLEMAGWQKPYIVTEWGANGSWEADTTAWGAEIEPTSTQKAAQIRGRYRLLGNRDNDCLGGYVFLWGNKQETTPTWYGLFSEDGLATEAVEVMKELWAEEPQPILSPRISELRLEGQLAWQSLKVSNGALLEAAFKLYPDSSAYDMVRWELWEESTDKRVGGDLEKRPRKVDAEFEPIGEGTVRFRAPEKKGAYRLFLELRNCFDRLATANFPFFAK